MAVAVAILSLGIQRKARSAMLRARRGTRRNRSDDDGSSVELVVMMNKMSVNHLRDGDATCVV
jgi:hypothetical protein